MKMNSSLIYEILLYLNSFYFGMFGVCEIGIYVLKAINFNYEQNDLLREGIILIVLITVETVRIIFGRNGSLSEHGWRVIVSVILILPCAVGVTYFLFFQQQILRFEYLLCALMLGLYFTELVYAILFVISRCRPVSYA